jgi:flagellar protein FlaG
MGGPHPRGKEERGMKVGRIEGQVVASDEINRSSGVKGRGESYQSMKANSRKLGARLIDLRSTERLKREEEIKKLRRETREAEMEYASYSRRLNYKKHQATDRYFVRVIDSSSDEVVREVPPQEELDRIAKMLQYLRTRFGMKI